MTWTTLALIVHAVLFAAPVALGGVTHHERQ